MEGRRLLFWWFGLTFERLCHEMEILYIIKIKYIYLQMETHIEPCKYNENVHAEGGKRL